MDAVAAERMNAHKRKLTLLANLITEVAGDLEHTRDQMLMDDLPALPAPVGEAAAAPALDQLSLVPTPVLIQLLVARGCSVAQPGQPSRLRALESAAVLVAQELNASSASFATPKPERLSPSRMAELAGQLECALKCGG